MSIKKNLGRRVKEMRISRRLTQEALAEKSNLSAKSLSQIELGNNFISAETLEDLCMALDISPKKLFDFQYPESEIIDPISDITARLKKNSELLKTIYKIVLALDK